MRTQIVLGTFFGAEGKGSTVQWLCKQAIDRGEKPIVVRFSGGQQAGHRIITNGIEHVCSSFGSGVLLGVPTYLDRNVIIDPICMYEEYQQLVAKGITPVIYINDNCRITTPYDVNANVNDSKVLGHGSCGMGIYHTFKRCEFMKQSEYGIYSLYGCGITNPSKCLGIARNYYKTEALPELDKRFVEACEWLSKTAKYEPIISGAAFRHYNVNAKEVTYIFEGSHFSTIDSLKYMKENPWVKGIEIFKISALAFMVSISLFLYFSISSRFSASSKRLSSLFRSSIRGVSSSPTS